MRNAESIAPTPLQVLETCLYVDDLDRAEAFYHRVLGLPVVERRDGRHLFLRVGDGMLLLFLPHASSGGDSEIPPHGATGPGHLAFHVPAAALSQWEQHLKLAGTELEQIVEWPGGMRSVYFRDPAGNSLELASAELWKDLRSR